MAWPEGYRLQEGRYTIDRVLGQGGFGITYLAWDNRRADWVVLKGLNDSVQQDPEFGKFQQDFMNEALRLAMCSLHPHVVKVDQVILEDDLWCIVMEYISGETLLDRIRRRGPLAEAESLLYTRQIGDALVMLHEQDILHRDVKPANVLLRQDRAEAVLIDFGLARDFSQGLIQHHTSWGTDGYAPIEQYDSLRRRGACIDVYALAATLYTMITREIPLCAPVRATGRVLEPPKFINPKLSDRTNQAILSGMAFDPKERPQTMQEWLDLLPDSGELETELGITTQDLRDLEIFLASEAQTLSIKPELEPISGSISELSPSEAPEPEPKLEPEPESEPESELPSSSPDPSPSPSPPGADPPLHPDPEAEIPIQAAPTLTETSTTQIFTPTVIPPEISLSRPQRDAAPEAQSAHGQHPPPKPDPFDRLKHLLAAGEWQKADRETARLMLKAVDQDRQGNFSVQAIETFPCPILRQLDQVWRSHSLDRFGFKTQYQILTQCNRNSERFGEQVGWKIRGEWLHSSQLIYDLRAPKGHLPVGFLVGCTGGMRSGLMILDRYIFNKYKKCL